MLVSTEFFVISFIEINQYESILFIINNLQCTLHHIIRNLTFTDDSNLNSMLLFTLKYIQISIPITFRLMSDYRDKILVTKFPYHVVELN